MESEQGSLGAAAIEPMDEVHCREQCFYIATLFKLTYFNNICKFYFHFLQLFAILYICTSCFASFYCSSCNISFAKLCIEIYLSTRYYIDSSGFNFIKYKVK